MLFRRKPKPPLQTAIRMVSDATEIAYKYLRDRKHLPSEKELHDLGHLARLLYDNHLTAQYIARKLRGRGQGAWVAGLE